MAWSLSSWLKFTRVFQLLGALAAAGLNGFLTAWVYSRQMGLAHTMAVLEVLICILLVYTTAALILQHTRKRTGRKGWLIVFIIFDLLFCAADLGIVSILSRAGLPNHCHGLTKEDLLPPTPKPDSYFTTPGFSDESEGQIGLLDKFCGHERSFFLIAMGLVFTYIATIVLGSLSIYETNHTRDSRVNEILDSLERAKDDNIQLKLLDSGSSPSGREPGTSVAAPASEGILTRTSSLRSTLTSLTSSTTGHRYAIPRRPIPQPAPPLPPRRLSLNTTASPPQSVGMGMGAGFTPVPLDEDSAEAALVADGMQHQPHRSHRRGASASNPQGMPMPMLLEEEAAAESALVSDGMRPSEPMLPPYEPGSSRMAGHGTESSDMRLSEYVKGETRAQDMKDSGRY